VSDLLCQFKPICADVFEGRDLRLGVFAAFILEEHVIRAAGIEGWIQVNQIDRFVWHIFAQDLEVIAVKECVLGDWFHCSASRKDCLDIMLRFAVALNPFK
jgi:hypothetical protein